MKPLTADAIEMTRQGLLNSEWCGFSKQDTVNQLCDLAMTGLLSARSAGTRITTANPERRSSLEHSELKPDGNEGRSEEVDRQGGGGGAITRGAALVAGRAECGSRDASREADREEVAKGEAANPASPVARSASERTDAGGSNYVTDHETFPQKVTFADGRVVKMVGQGHLFVGWEKPSGK